MRFVLLFAILLHVSFSQTLQEGVERLLASSAAAERAFWGVEVVDLQEGRTLVRCNANRFFTPASNTKLFTTALALMRLGPDHRFVTKIAADCAPDGAGRIAGDLRLVGGGDPALSARTIPYQKGPSTGDPLRAIESLADQAVACGLRRVDGDIVGDDTAYVWAPYPEGWAQDDAVWEYGAPVSALTVNDNMFSLALDADVPGVPPAITLRPGFEYYLIDNRVRVGRGFDRKVQIDRAAGSRELKVWGTLPAGSNGFQTLLAIDDPALYAASVLADALSRRGVAIRGRPVARHRFENQVADLKNGEDRPAETGFVLAQRTSPPLVDLLRVIDKVSQNLHAEMVLREVGRMRRNIGSREAGLEEMHEFLKEAGIDPGSYNLRDGSGLSRLNLITPDAAVKLLAYLYRSPCRDEWISLLPVGGQDGTLSTRFEGWPEGRRIRAKTGSLSHVAALSGYVESKSRGTLAFSILANNFYAPSSEIRAIIDKICMLISN